MAKQIEGVYDRVLKCAKKEFLEKGFKDASLRMIAREASTSTGSIYTRFKDKDGLFKTIVQPVMDMITEISNQVQSEFNEKDAQTQKMTMGDVASEGHSEILDFIYDYKEEFQLLLTCSHGSSCEFFIDELIELEENSTISYLKSIGHSETLKNPVIKEFVHILATSYCHGIFEPLLHNMSREKAHEFDKMFLKYHLAGFHALFNK